MEGVQTVDVSWLHHSQKGQCPVSDTGPSSHIRGRNTVAALDRLTTI